MLQEDQDQVSSRGYWCYCFEGEVEGNSRSSKDNPLCQGVHFRKLLQKGKQEGDKSLT